MMNAFLQLNTVFIDYSDISICKTISICLLNLYFYTPCKRQKTFGFLTFSAGIEMGQWREMD